MTRQRESDDQALQGIPPRLHRVWKRYKRRYPLSMASDERAARFMEDYVAGELEEAAYLELEEEAEGTKEIRAQKKRDRGLQRQLDAEKRAKKRAERKARIEARKARDEEGAPF